MTILHKRIPASRGRQSNFLSRNLDSAPSRSPMDHAPPIQRHPPPSRSPMAPYTPFPTLMDSDSLAAGVGLSECFPPEPHSRAAETVLTDCPYDSNARPGFDALFDFRRETVPSMLGFAMDGVFAVYSRPPHRLIVGKRRGATVLRNSEFGARHSPPFPSCHHPALRMRPTLTSQQQLGRPTRLQQKGKNGVFVYLLVCLPTKPSIPMRACLQIRPFSTRGDPGKIAKWKMRAAHFLFTSPQPCLNAHAGLYFPSKHAGFVYVGPPEAWSMRNFSSFIFDFRPPLP